MLRKQVLLALLCFNFFLTAHSQISPAGYASRWKKVDSLIDQKGLPQSALSEVNSLYALARRERNEPQLIKALVYRLNLQQQLSAEGLPVAIAALQREVDSSRQPARSILENMLAGLYDQYMVQNIWRLINRTAVTQRSDTAIATWTLDDLNRKVAELYLASLRQEALLAGIDPGAFAAIVVKGNASVYRPTLFDLLAHRALDYFGRGSVYMAKPASVFEIDDPTAFADAASFVRHSFSTGDSLAPHYQAVLLYQRLIRLHLGDLRPDALVDVDIERLRFMNANAVFEDRDSAYLSALKRVTDKYGDLPAAAEAWYLLSDHYAGAANAGTDSAGYLKAREICERVVARPDSSQGKTDCHALLHSLLEQQLALQTEEVNLPGKPMRMLVSWKNFDRLYLRVVRLDEDQSLSGLVNRYYDSAAVKKLLLMPAYRSYSTLLPPARDLREHRVELPVASLAPGAYVVVASPDSSWNTGRSVVCVKQFAVSSIAFISEGNHYFVLNRETGRPIEGANVQVWEERYSGGKMQPVKKEAYTTDKNGYFLYRQVQGDAYGGRVLDIRIGGDRLLTAGGGIVFPLADTASTPTDKRAYEAAHARCFLFTDRSIYRPGQTLYFKGILVTRDYESRRLRPMTGFVSSVVLMNPNGEGIDTLQVTTDEYGSYHGTFTLPVNQLNGRFRLVGATGNGSMNFSVEEYKRPRFYVKFGKQQRSYRVGDSIRVTGTAMGYAGNFVDGAKVSYRVVRKTRFPYPWMNWRTLMPSVPDQEIAHGVLRTDATGAFSFVFFASPDRRASKSLNPEFDFDISSDVTDMSGETRMGATTVVAGYAGVKLAIQLPQGDHLAADSFRRVEVKIENLAGEPVSARVGVTVTALKAPQRLIRERLWAAPDRYMFTEKEWLDSFPHDEYREEAKKEDWKRGIAVVDTVATRTSGILALKPGRLAPGWYVIEATTTDSLGVAVKDRHYVELYDGATGRPGGPEYSWGAKGVVTAEPGEEVKLAVGSSARDVYVIRAVERSEAGRRGAINSTFSFFGLSDEGKVTSMPIGEGDRGGFGVLDAFVRDNRLYTHWTAVRVPWTNKQLQIHYASFRDKTHPGSKEQWRLQISGAKGEQVSAEVLTTLYDASLDQFRLQQWRAPGIYPLFPGKVDWNGWGNFSFAMSQLVGFRPYQPLKYVTVYDELLQPGEMGRRPRPMVMKGSYNASGFANEANPDLRFGAAGAPGSQSMVRIRGTSAVSGDTVEYAAAPGRGAGAGLAGAGAGNAGAGVEGMPPEVQLRKDFRETAFFFPDLQTDSLGNVSFSFTMPEAVTAWKWLTLAGTRDLAFGYSEKTVVTQKELMVEPNAPRFLREGDRMELPVKIVNLTDSELTGQMSLQLTDPTTGQTADGWFVNRQPNQYFTVAARQSAVVSFPLDIPFQYNRPLTYRVIAESGHYSDGEEATLPVVSNRQLVTESMPLNMPGDGTRHFVFDKLLKSGSSETLNHHLLTVEFTANPAWYAVESLPYLAEYPYECAEQTFERFYANALASKIATGSPRLQQVFARWREADTAQLLSNLQKDQELKTVLLEETPWVLSGRTEEQQKKNIALLFDVGRMSGELGSALERLAAAQGPDGAFPWFKGGPDDRYITQYILCGIGHLLKLGAIPVGLNGRVDTMVRRGLGYLDGEIVRDYERDRARSGVSGPGRAGANVVWASDLPIQYLYMRSLFSGYGIPGEAFPAVNYYRKKAQQGWLPRNRMLQGMIALALYRTGDVQTARDIIASLKQNALHDEELGMYWKRADGGYYWYDAPIETQALLIEAFREINGNAAIDRELKTWLLRQKQTHHWPTTIATADACYALLMGGEDWLKAERAVTVRLGDKTIEWPERGAAGAGYYKKVIDGPFVRPSMGDVTVTMHTKGGDGSPAWGAVYWQYFDMLDRITPTGGPKPVLSVRKRLFVERNTDRGPVLDSVADNGTMKPGDRVIVRLELRADRDLEYVHMKDMRAACMEPVHVLSEYRWQGGLGYYESTRDVATDFFFNRMPRGVYVFEYPLTVAQTGNFSNGITTIECLYAPEFSYHTEGIRVNVEGAP